MTLPPDLPDTLRRLTGHTPTHFTPVPGGYTPALRLLAHFGDAPSVFVKRATDPNTAAWLRAEHCAYTTLKNAPFLAKFLAFEDAPTPTLLLEDLSRHTWRHTWTPAKVQAVLDLLATVRTHPHPPVFPRAAAFGPLVKGWPLVAEDPVPFLSLNLCTTDWLDENLPTLLAAERAVRWDGQDLLHFDVRSDNICFIDDARPVLVDWNHTATGNGQLDLASWLPSLHAEGGPLPDTLLPAAGPLLAPLSGYWAARAGLPEPYPNSTIRQIQLTQLKAALPWTARALGLPPPTTA